MCVFFGGFFRGVALFRAFQPIATATGEVMRLVSRALLYW